jgi:hypothetical protein
MGFKLVKHEIKTVTRDVAKQFSTMAASPTEREFIPKRVEYLRDRIVQLQRAIPFFWVMAKCGDEIFRMNGQHSSKMLAGLDGKFPKDLIAVILTYEVDSLADLPVLFQQFDDRRSTRTLPDVAGAFQGVHPDIAAVERKTAKLAADGYIWFVKNRVSAHVLPVIADEAYAVFEDEDVRKFVLWTEGILTIKTPELKTSPVIAAMFGCREVEPDKADLFWKEVGQGLDDGTPPALLGAWLLQAAEQRDPRKKLTGQQLHQGCVYAWRAFIGLSGAIRDIKADLRKGYLPFAPQEFQEAAE